MYSTFYYVASRESDEIVDKLTSAATRRESLLASARSLLNTVQITRPNAIGFFICDPDGREIGRWYDGDAY
jgi:hypothetical protein